MDALGEHIDIEPFKTYGLAQESRTINSDELVQSALTTNRIWWNFHLRDFLSS